MVVFDNLDGLKVYLKQDHETVSLNPVRFINVDSMVTWIEVKKYLMYLSEETVRLSEFCEEQDTTPNINRVSTKLKNVYKSSLVMPLSEYLRIIPEQAGKIINRFIKLEYRNNDNGKLRVYFLMYRMKELLQTIREDDPRAKDCIILFTTDEETDYKLTIIQNNLDVRISGNEIHGFSKYLQYWETNPDKPIILYTENAVHFEKNRFFDNVRVLVTPYDIIKYQFSLPSGINEELGSDEYWIKLVKILLKEGSFHNVCCSEFSINKYSETLFEYWNKYDAFHKWLLWLWIRQQVEDEYEIKVADSCKTYLNFEDELYCLIIKYLHTSDFDKAYKRRKLILSFMNAVPTERFWNEIHDLENVDMLSCLTCLADSERKKIFKILSCVNYSDRTSVLPILKIIYPQLYYYLQNDDFPNVAGLLPEHEQYFIEYRWLKATDSITKDFVEKVKNIALKKGADVFKICSRCFCVNKQYDERTAILFVDGMGVEYVDYLAHLFSDLDNEKFSVTYEIGFCNLPSTTENNTDFLKNKNLIEPPVRELDELKHSNIVYPESIIRQFDILEQIKNRVIGSFNSKIHRIIIASDHGTSRMAVKVRNTEYDNVLSRPENIDIYKYGRYSNDITDEAKYPTAINFNNYMIFADYTRFTQNGAPIDEIHGGASLEEWIVPIITIEKYDDRVSRRVVVLPKSGLVSRYDYVSFDEIQSIKFTDSMEMQGALKGYLESGEYRVGDTRGVGDAGLVLLGNIESDLMDVNRNMFKDLPEIFHESALLDRFHGFIKGWNIPKMKESLKATGWALNTEYFGEIMHILREELSYRAVVDQLLQLPKNSATRDTEAVKRICTGYLKLLFPNVTDVSKLEDIRLFETYCLEPAMEMRRVIKTQLGIIDIGEFGGTTIPNITIKEQYLK